MHAFSYVWSLPVTWQRWRSRLAIRRSRKPHATANPMALFVIEPALWVIECYIAGTAIMDIFGSCDLDLDPMTFIYELDPYCLELNRMCKYELRMSRLSTDIVWQRQTYMYIHTDIQTDKITEIIKHAPSRVLNKERGRLWNKNSCFVFGSIKTVRWSLRTFSKQR